MTNFRTLDSLDLAGQKVLLRVDMNVPFRHGEITDTTRIEKVVPTIREIIGQGATVILASHLGRPKGQAASEMSLSPLASALTEFLEGVPVRFYDQFKDGWDVTAATGEVLLLENLRFDPGEEANDPEFARKLAALGDVYVDDAFSCAHRAHSSIDGVAHLLPAAAGRLMQRELEALTNALETPARPVAAIIGGNKVSTKLGVLENLLTKVDYLVIGGAMANTFLFASGIEIGTSLCETDMADTARDVLAKAKENDCRVVLPTDAAVAGELKDGAVTSIFAADALPGNQMILDIGPESVTHLFKILGRCKTVVWNGPLGAFEFKPFDNGTNAVAGEVARLTGEGNLLSVAGGGDTMAALANAGAADGFDYISTAGGAFLEWLEGKTLPGIAVLM
ncbi:MAG: phosphoglycerate kinase [Rhodospirillaceae bacterium]|nr:phosphoglycerate kinase [Rhodospirillaceae bacterium]